MADPEAQPIRSRGDKAAIIGMMIARILMINVALVAVAAAAADPARAAAVATRPGPANVSVAEGITATKAVEIHAAVIITATTDSLNLSSFDVHGAAFMQCERV